MLGFVMILLQGQI